MTCPLCGGSQERDRPVSGCGGTGFIERLLCGCRDDLEPHRKPDAVPEQLGVLKDHEAAADCERHERDLETESVGLELPGAAAGGEPAGTEAGPEGQPDDRGEDREARVPEFGEHPEP